MNATSLAIAVSLLGLTTLLAVLTARGLARFAETRSRSQVMWGSGLGLAAAAMGVESAVFLGSVNSAALQLYVFLSAGIVGVLSLGATKILKSPRLENAYTAYVLGALGVVALACALTPLPTAMVAGGIIVGNPPILLIVLSSLVTFPATVVLLTATAISLRRSRRWQTLLMAAGAVILGAGGTLYIASFPIALYYAEFVGILLLFLGLLSLQPASRAVPSSAPAPPTAG